MNLGNNIKIARENKKITQKELAKRIEVSVISIQNYENNRRQPKIETLKKIADALNMQLTDLISNNLDDVTKEYSVQDDLLNLRIKGIKYYLNENFLKDSEKTVLMNFTNDLLLEYTEMLKKIWSLERNWDDLYNEYNKNSSLNESDLKILYLRENLNAYLKNLSDRINGFPGYIVHNEIKSTFDLPIVKNDSE